jgi:hypothetical protein
MYTHMQHLGPHPASIPPAAVKSSMTPPMIAIEIAVAARSRSRKNEPDRRHHDGGEKKPTPSAIAHR